MLILLSPAKTMDFDPVDVSHTTQARFLDETDSLIDTLRTKKANDLMALMHVSEKIASLNVERNHAYQRPLEPGETSKPALLAFQGCVQGAWSGNLQRRGPVKGAGEDPDPVGLYGVLRPLDLIRPYRLEMGTASKPPPERTCTNFWKQTDQLA